MKTNFGTSDTKDEAVIKKTKDLNVGSKFVSDLISIIVPCMNVSKFLDACFFSLEQQTYTNFEVIFVNDGSTDDTLQMLEAFCQKHTNCSVINQKNQGISAARNNGIAAAKGEFVYFFDSDDMLAPNLLEVLHKNIEGFDISICKAKTVKETFSQNKIKAEKPEKPKAFEGKENILTQLLSTCIFNVTIWNKLYRHSILKQFETYPNVLDPNIHYGEDLDFNFMYFSHCNNANFTASKLYYYRKRKGSEVHSKFNAKKMLSIFAAHEKNIKICKQNFPDVEKYVRAFVCTSCVEMLFRIYASEFADKEVIFKLFSDLKQNLKFLNRAKKLQRYKRWTIPLAVPLIKLLFVGR